MKKNNIPFLVGTLVVASLVAVRCGGDDTTGGGASGSGGSGGTGGGAGSTAGTAGTSAGTAGSAGSAAGGGGSTGGVGGGGSAGTAGTAGGSSEGGVTDAGDAGGACPAQPPMEDAPCSKKQVCQYTNTDCACAKGGGPDAGRGWTCISTDAGVDSDAAACPAAPVDGDACTTKGQRCPIGDAGARCVCAKDVWNCP